MPKHLLRKAYRAVLIAVSASNFTPNALAQGQSLQRIAGIDAALADPAYAYAPSPAPAKPRIALTYLGRNVDSPADQALAARYDFVVLGLWPGMTPSRLQATVTGIKSLKPSIKLAQYSMLQEMADAAPTGDVSYPLWQALSTNNWWLRTAAGSRTQWTPIYSAYDINITAWSPTDSNGQRWQQVKAKFDTDKLFANMKGIDYVYLDGFDVPLVDGDWKRIGSNQSHTDPAIMSAYRKGNVDYANILRTLNPGLKLIGNSASIESAEYKGQLEGAYRECLMGKIWSHETRLGWTPMMDSYRAALANTKAPNDVIFGACSSTADPALYRYGIASALLEDGYFAFSVNGYQSFPWFDESDAPLGTAAEAPPKAPTPSGIWMRKYTNGLVLVNPSKTTAASIDLGTGYKHLSGTIDPTVNNGLPVSILTLRPRQGLIVIKQ